MNLPYFWRLVCLSLASLFLVHLAAGLAVAAITRPAVRFAEVFRARNGARFLFALRLAPLVIALCTVAGMCIPSYLWMEPDSIDEPVGYLCLAAVALSAAIWIGSIGRAMRAIVRSNQYIRAAQRHGTETRIAGERPPAWITETEGPLIALAGVFRPRLFLSRRAVSAFSPDEMCAALRHERAHWISRDNLKRLVLLLAPQTLPFRRQFIELERAWARLAEWAADDRAADGGPQHSVSMAAALVRAARLDGQLHPAPDLATGLLTGRDELAARVDRLLRPAENRAGRNPSIYAYCVCFLMACAALAVVLRPATLVWAHRALEQLIR